MSLGKGLRLKTVQYLDAVKKKLGVESDYALAAALDMTRFGVSKLRRGHSAMGNTTAVRIAAILDLNPLRVIADAELERGSDAQLWGRLREAAAALVMAIGAALFPLPDAQAAGFNINIATVPADFPSGNVRPGRLTVYTLRALLALVRSLVASVLRMIGGRA